VREHKGAHPLHKCCTAAACKYAVEESAGNGPVGGAKKEIRRCDMDHYKDIEDIPMVFGPRELSKILGISKNKTYEVVNRYDFPKIRVGRRIIISKKHFLEWMDANFGKERNNT